VLDFVIKGSSAWAFNEAAQRHNRRQRNPNNPGRGMSPPTQPLPGCCGFTSICNKEPRSYSLGPSPSLVGRGGESEGERQNLWVVMRTV